MASCIAEAIVVLLDTHALIWLVQGETMSEASIAAIEKAAARGEVLVSSVSAWEIGLLAVSQRFGLRFLPSPAEWFTRVLTMPGIQLTPLNHVAAIAASFLPNGLHRDPADRLLVATARERGASFVTRDRMILAYAAEGYVQAIAC